MANIQKFSLLKIIDYEPQSPISIYYGYVVHIYKLFRPLNYSLKN